jgi:DNA-binding response OmpR family regulator
MNSEVSSQRKILFVDDEQDITEFLCYNFKKFGFDVREAGNGLEGKAIVETWMPDIVVADIFMPEMNGIGFCRAIKKNESTKNIPVVFLSAANDDYLTLNAMEAGAQHFLSKPIKIDVLQLVVNNILQEKKQAS